MTEADFVRFCSRCPECGAVSPEPCIKPSEWFVIHTARVMVYRNLTKSNFPPIETRFSYVVHDVPDWIGCCAYVQPGSRIDQTLHLYSKEERT